MTSTCADREEIAVAFPTDLEIARAAELRPLSDVAADAGIPADLLEPYGRGPRRFRSTPSNR